MLGCGARATPAMIAVCGRIAQPDCAICPEIVIMARFVRTLSQGS